MQRYKSQNIWKPIEGQDWEFPECRQQKEEGCRSSSFSEKHEANLNGNLEEGFGGSLTWPYSPANFSHPTNTIKGHRAACM
jgi:hypothetical protein